jgi:hypothetical protein
MSKVFLHSPEAIQRHLRRDIEPAGFDSNGVRFVLCDDQNQVLFHCHVGDVPSNIGPVECSRTLSLFAHSMSRGGDGAILLALTRPGPLTLTASDRRWFRAAYRARTAYAVRLLGVHVVTPRGQREVVLDDVL